MLNSSLIAVTASNATTTPTVTILDYAFSRKTVLTQIALIVLLSLVSITGNSMIVILIKRFTSLRTISNFALANMAFVDMMNIVTNLPWFAVVGVAEMHHIARGKTMSLVIAMSQAFFNNIKVFSMLVMIMERYLAISLGMRYRVWMTKKKMAWSILLLWVVSVILNVPWFLALYKIDLGDAPTMEYRIVYFRNVGKTASFFVFSICGLVIAVISLLTRRSFKKQMEGFEKRQRNGQDPQSIQLTKDRTRKDARAAFTIGLTITAYVLCYVPAILYAYFFGNRNEIANTSTAKWFGFAANYFLFVSSACNPLIYILRSSRLRRATAFFFKTLCSSSDKLRRPKDLATARVNNCYATASRSTRETSGTRSTEDAKDDQDGVDLKRSNVVLGNEPCSSSPWTEATTEIDDFTSGKGHERKDCLLETYVVPEAADQETLRNGLEKHVDDKDISKVSKRDVNVGFEDEDEQLKFVLPDTLRNGLKTQVSHEKVNEMSERQVNFGFEDEDDECLKLGRSPVHKESQVLFENNIVILFENSNKRHNNDSDEQWQTPKILVEEHCRSNGTCSTNPNPTLDEDKPASERNSENRCTERKSMTNQDNSCYDNQMEEISKEMEPDDKRYLSITHLAFDEDDERLGLDETKMW